MNWYWYTKKKKNISLGYLKEKSSNAMSTFTEIIPSTSSGGNKETYKLVEGQGGGPGVLS